MGQREGRASKRDAILPNRLKSALRRLNPVLPQDRARRRLHGPHARARRDRPDPRQCRGSRADPQRRPGRGAGKSGERKTETVRVIDWDDPEANDFFLASQVWFAGELYTRRADLVGFVNGMPLLFVELKASHKAMADAYDGNLADYRDDDPAGVHAERLRHPVQRARGRARRALRAARISSPSGSGSTTRRRPGVVSLETLIRGTCRPARFLDLVENFIAFEEGKRGLVKKLAKNHQLLGVNRAIEAVDEIEENQGRLGVFWHTQGSRQEPVDAVLRRKVLRKTPGNWTFVIVTDRAELDDQIAGTFAACGALTKLREDGAGAEPRASEGAAARATSATSSR